MRRKGWKRMATEQELRQSVVNVMRGWLGYNEKNGKFRSIIDLYNTQKPLPVGHKVKYTDEWCATAVTAAGIQAGLHDIILGECPCSRMIALYQAAGRWMENDAYRPQPGDIIMYDWDDTGAGENKGAPEHVGIVAEVNGNTLTIIEGNKGQAVATRTMAVNGRYIRGYCLPDYAGKAESEDDDMTQEQFNQMMTEYERTKNPVPDNTPADWEAPAVQWARDNGLLAGDGSGNLMLHSNMTRAQFLVMLKKYHEKKSEIR